MDCILICSFNIVGEGIGLFHIQELALGAFDYTYTLNLPALFFFQTKTINFYMQLWGTHTYVIYVGDHPIPSLGFTAFCN